MARKAGALMLVLAAIVIVGVAAVSADPQRPSPRERPVLNAALTAAIAETGLDRAEVVAGLRSGNSLAVIVNESGGDARAVIIAAVAVGQAQIDAALARGQLTEDQAAALSTDLANAVESAVNGELGLRWIGPRAVRAGAVQSLVGAVAGATGLTMREVVAEWRDGRTLSAIAEANGASSDAIVAAAVADATDRLTALVEAGRMTQTQADLLNDGLAERYTQAMNAPHGANGLTTWPLRSTFRLEAGRDFNRSAPCFV